MKLLDLFCGAGGAAMGYHQAGFDEIVGIDNQPQPNYPFTFIQADALNPPLDLEAFDLVHASPPCQAYSRLRHLPWLKDRIYPDLIPPTREMLQAHATPWVIENVEDAPLGHEIVAIKLCGRAFGLPLFRHRWFESTVPLMAPPHFVHSGGGGGKRINDRRSQKTEVLTIAGHSSGWSMDEQRAAMGIDWMRRDELTQAIPPAYTRFIGEQFMAQQR